MKTLTLAALLTSLAIIGCTDKKPKTYEYRAMSLIEMFKDDPDARKKISDIMVTVDGEFNRTDMDTTDYTKALNRLADNGWELVAVNRSNYWIFKKPTNP